MHKRAKGNIGENIACLFLEKKGFRIVARNYQKKWGELDIVARKGGTPHFFEVKSVAALRARNPFDAHRPEDNIHSLKVRHIRRMIETYLLEHGSDPDAEFRFHVICVFMDLTSRRAKVKWMENVIL
jgi:putative endonuclease